MRLINLKLATTLGMLCFAAGVGHAPDVSAQSVPGGIDIAQQPLFTATGQPPLNMLVMGKDHKIYYEAYNDASDLDADGALDIGYKPAAIDYYGYFNSFACYTWSTDRFVPNGATANKQCSGSWSGDFLNYLTMSRMDALRRVLYGGWRQVDGTTDTTLQGAFLPQDGHSWGKEYQSIARDGYNIANYAPLTAPGPGRYHLFAVTTVTGNANTFAAGYQAPLFRVLKDTDKRIWNWLSIEGPVAGNKCFTSANSRVDCVQPAGTAAFPGHPANRGSFGTMENNYAIPANLFGSGPVATINCATNACNPYGVDDNYLTIITGTFRSNTTTYYQFRVDGDDAIDVDILLAGVSVGTAGCYGGRGFGICAGAELTAPIQITGSTNYTFKFRHEDAAGGDGYRLEYRTCTGPAAATCTGGFAVVPNSNVTGISNTTISTYNLTPTVPAVTRDDYLVRVQSCPASNAALRESTCKAYPNGQFKPTGILHDYGESARMYFGLITGTQNNNLEGGVLRRNVSNFGEEIDPDTGQFLTTVNGIANSISRLRMIGGAYGSGTNNLNADSNWSWGGGTGNCPSIGNRAIVNGECRMWGNPLAEMLYESMRYYAGAAGPTARFNTGGATQGATEETTMGLTRPTWKNPYAPAPDGGGFLACAKPYQTIISDINPSYDGDLPGSAFAGAITSVTTTPPSISSFNAAAQGQLIWTEEFGGARSVFIGDNNVLNDGAPTAKIASSFGNIRGLAPEEPTKGGTYYSASVARYGRVTDLSTAEGDQNLSTYAIALASPLPRIDFPIGAGKITLVPFAKTASGTFGDGTRKPTNTIVDFYVESIANLPGQPFNVTINEGRPYAVFRINYEDVEQGNDHDMDAIVRYLISANADGTVTVTLNSEYAAGSADQNMGFVMSGTTQDGVYLDVRDTDSGAGSYVPYSFNTPNPVLPGGCGIAIPPAACAAQLPLNSTRVFTPAAVGGGGGAIFLNDPLWYAAKYGAPVPGANDVNADGVPDNYFLVTNPATLRQQLENAFSGIIDTSQPTASVATSAPRFTPGATLAYEAQYTSTDWSGDIRAYRLASDGTYDRDTVIWSASNELPSASARNIYTSQSEPGGLEATPFTTVGLNTAAEAAVLGTLDPAIYDIDELIAHLRGDQSNEVGAAGCSLTDPEDCPYRKRTSRLGDVLNSTPAVVGVTSFGYGSILETVAPGPASSYSAFVESKKAIFGDNGENPILFVGANDGMLHAFDGSEGAGGGEELFAYMPHAVLPNINRLATPGYVHRFYVDGTPTVTDAFLGSWRTVLGASAGAGARSVFALDVTNPRNFDENDVLWEFNQTVDDDMGFFVGRPYIGITEGGGWVAAFGNGYNSARHRAVLFVRDLADGSEIATVDTGVGCSSLDPSCVEGPNGLSTAAIVDNDGNGAGDTIYAGDYQGNLWRFELSGGTWILGNNDQPLFVARDPTGKRQSITSGVYTVANPLGGTMVIFGTGRYLNTQDADENALGTGTRATMDTLYGIWDSRTYDPNTGAWTETFPIASRPVTGVDLEYADLQKQVLYYYDGDGFRKATRFPVDYRLTASGVGEMGWYMDLECDAAGGPDGICSTSMVGERVTASPQGILTDVVFNTFRPEGDTCEPGSQNAVLVLDALAGAASYVPIEPTGGWPLGIEPPGPGLVGTDTLRGPPPGEPPIVIIRPPNPGVPCLPGDPSCTDACTPGDPGCADCVTGDLRPQCQCDPVANPGCDDVPTTCSWRSPNAAGRPAGKLIPCGRISWKQLR